MSIIYDWIRKVAWPLPLHMAGKLYTGRIDTLDMIHILVAIEQHDQCKGWIMPKGNKNV